MVLYLNQALEDDLYRLQVTGSVTDEFGNQLSDGTDFAYQFRMIRGNLFENGDFDDCEGVSITPPW